MLLVKLIIPVLQAERKRHPVAKEFLVGLKRQARVDWWPSLHALQTVQRFVPPNRRFVHKDAMGDWLDIGTALGLSLETEQKRHEKEGTRRCSWFACPNHRVAPDNTVKPMSCKGCGDAQYCNRVCQKRYVSCIAIPS
ncbi:hypothetical protein PENSPDRAFT_325029 [Peniophora sp. CONT]|nr:hypothetical protein PENSPDRAFT_325029 [Peniophora sp. CONT]